MADTDVAGASIEFLLALLAVALLLLLVGACYLLKDRSSITSENVSRSFLSRILLADTETMTRLDLERIGERDERWKCGVCDFANALDKRQCVLCGTKRLQPSASGISLAYSSSHSLTSHHGSSSHSLPSLSSPHHRAAKHSSRPPLPSSASSSSSSASASASALQLQRQRRQPSTLSLSALNPRQRYARKRKEWVRRLADDGSAYWVRQDIVYRQPQPYPQSEPQAQPDPLSASTSAFTSTATSTSTSSTSTSPPALAQSQSGSEQVHPSQCRPSSGFVTLLVRSSVHSEGRLTFAETSRADAATTIAGYRVRADEMALIDHVSQLPFPQKYAWFLERMTTLLRPWDDGRIKLRVHREAILVESMEQLLGIQREHLHFPLRIEFIGESGIDAGGLQREWFSLLFTQLLDDGLGLFMRCHRNNQSVAINPNSVACTADHLLYFRGIGRLMGRALLEGQTMAARLCLPMLKHVLGVPITFSDLQYVDPEVYKSMTWIRENDHVDALALTFSVTELRSRRGRRKTSASATMNDPGDAAVAADVDVDVDALSVTVDVDNSDDSGGVDVVVIDLIPNGREVEVTDANKAEYLHLKLRYLMLDRYAAQLQALSLGLFEVIPQENLMVFDYQELELVLCGLPEIDLVDWKRHTVVAAELVESPLVDWFWEVLAQLTEEERARFLQYSTGSARVPVQGFRGLTSYDGRLCPFALRALPQQTRGFPRVHTCFNRVELPLYATKMELETALYAILEMELSEFSEE